jgi:hypothetical protein
MTLLFAALMIALAFAAAANMPKQIRNADRRGGHRMVDLSRIAAWPSFDRAGIHWPDPAAIERAIGEERSAAYARLVVGRRLTP